MSTPLADAERAVTHSIVDAIHAMAGWLNKRPTIGAADIEVVCSLTVDSDIQLRQILAAAQDFFVYDEDDLSVTKQFTFGTDRVRIVIDTAAMPADDVYRIIAENQPPW